VGNLSNYFLASVANRRNRRKSRMTRRLIDWVSDDRNLIVCGGRSGDEDSEAAAIQKKILAQAIDSAVERGRGALFAYSGPELTQELRAAFAGDPDTVFFGVNTAYQPFDRNVSFSDAWDILARSARCYADRTGADFPVLSGILQFLLTILRDHLDSRFFTFRNLCYLADHLLDRPGSGVRDADYTGEAAFFAWVERETGKRPSGFMLNLLTVNWEQLLAVFYPYWMELCRQLDTLRISGKAAPRSLYSCIRQGRVCICCLPSENSWLLQACLFGELALLRKQGAGFDFLSQQVNLEGCKDDHFLDYPRCRSCLAGSSLKAMGLNGVLVHDPQYVCLGMSLASDARDFLDAAVAAEERTEVQLNVGRWGTAGFGRTQKKPLTESDLMLRNIRDGQGYLIDSAGYRFIHFLLV